MSYSIYLITCLATGKSYIGRSKKPKQRWYFHCYNASQGSSNYFHRAIRRYGKETFSLEIIEDVEDLDCAKAREAYWIAERQTLAPQGYNSIPGGDDPEHANAMAVASKARRKAEDPVAYKAAEMAKGRKVSLSLAKVDCSARAVKGHASRTKESHQAWSKRASAKIDYARRAEQQKAKAALEGYQRQSAMGKKYWSDKSPEERRKIQMDRWARMPPERYAAMVAKRVATKRAMKAAAQASLQGAEQ